MTIYNNMDVSIRHVDGVKIEYSVAQSEGRASFNPYFLTSAAWLIGDAYGKPESHRFSLTVNAASVAKFNRFAEAIADIFAEDDSADAQLQAAE